MNSWNFPGAKWWKFDFHTHTPASDDFMPGCPPDEKNTVTPEFWLQKFMEEGVDCVAITDHNSGEWIDKLKEKVEQIRTDKPEWYRPLWLFPGVEISVHGGVHILAIFDCDKKSSDIDSLLGAVAYQGTKGKSDGVTKKSITEVIDAIHAADGIVIPAHADKEKGLFRMQDTNTQRQVLNNPNIHAIELCDDKFSKPQIYQEEKVQWTEVCGSDTHNFRSDHFGTFTWVKMGEPSIEGLKLALIDGCASVNRDGTAQPNEHADSVIESIEVSNAKYMGRNNVLKCELSPFLNTIIGGRGSGKSTILEFMRFVLRRKDELPEQIKDDYENYFSARQDGLLTESSSLHLVYRKGSTRYRLNWANWETAPVSPSLEEWSDTLKGWDEMEGEISSLFPVSIYSQKQIFELAKNPQGLLAIIDKEYDVKFEEYYRIFQDCSNSCKQNLQQRNQLNARIAEEKKLKGELRDFVRQIEQVEKSGHKDVLWNYQLRKQQLSEIESVEQHWQTLFENISDVFAEADMVAIDTNIFAKHPEILTALEETQQQWVQKIGEIRLTVKNQIETLKQWQQRKTHHDWMKNLQAELQQYEKLHAQLQQQGIDPQTYPDLLRRRTLAEKELQQMAVYKKQREELGNRYWDKVAEVKKCREKLTERRTQFLDHVLRGNQSVKIQVQPFAEPWEDMEKEIRKILQTGDRFDKDINALKQIVGENGWEQAKQQIVDIRTDKESPKDVRFQAHLKDLPHESMVDMRLWFPEDALQITYGEKGKKISQGSPGQRSAALLAFILTYSDEPLLLDQPEDDLDNDLIYNLIVQNIKATKTNRQIIVVTHNANIVVNGDSEMVHYLEVKGGQSHIKSDSLQSPATRQRVCDTLEGGKVAFEQRYKRIHLED